MKINFKMLAAMLFTTASLTSSAQVTPQAVTDQKNLLMQFKGKWETDKATIKTDGPPADFPYVAEFSPTADNNGLLMTESATIPGMGKLMGTNLVGVSPYDGKVHWFSVDNIDVAHEHVGKFTDSKHFSMEYRGAQNGKKYAELLKIEFPDSNTLILRQESLLDGKQVALITGTFKRTKMQ
jgi:hypothetical protein